MSTPKTLSAKDLACALAVIVIWGSNFVFMKFVLKDFTPFQMGAARYLAAALPLVLFIKPPAMPWKWVVLYGLFQGVGQFGFLFLALQVGMTASLASVLMQTHVFFTALLSFVWLRERLTPPLVGGLVLAGLGLSCFALNFAARPEVLAVTVGGFALNLCGAAFWAASNIVARKAQGAAPAFEPLPFLVWSSLVPVLPFVGLSWAFDAPAPSGMSWLDAAKWASVPLSSWLSVLFLGWVATILAYTLWTGLLKRHPANRVAPFSLGVPVVGISAGMLTLGEQVQPLQWAGIALVVSALACVMLGDRLMTGYKSWRSKTIPT